MSSNPDPSNCRRSTRIPCELPVTLSSLHPGHGFSAMGVIILVNPQGCAARFSQPLEIETAVLIEGLPSRGPVRARVVNCISLGRYEKSWLLGLALDEPGNVWGIQTPPGDWA